jgi:hypothetical protein
MSRRRLLVGLVLFAFALTAVAYLGAGLLDSPQVSPTDADSPADDQVIRPVENGSKLWPYTSRSRSVDGRTLAVNVVIRGDPADVEAALTDRSGLGFEELPEDEAEAEDDTYRIRINESNVDWDDAHGSTRYSYIAGEGGGWMDESYQFHAGEYLGQRHHIRGYNDPNGEFSAIQIHREYFDFFRLRHQVTDIDDSATMLEEEFIDEPFVDEVSREYHGLTGGWSDGWLSTIRLGTLFPASGLLGLFVVGSVVSSGTRRAIRSLASSFAAWTGENWPGFALVVSLVVVVTGVRSLGIAFERFFTDISPQLFAGGVYPILAFGPPLVVGLFVRRIDPLPAFGFATVGLGTAFTLDTLWVGLGVVPVRFVLHRFGLMLALGVLALGVAREISDDTDALDHERKLLIAIGLIAWFAGLFLPLFGVV